MKIPVAKKLVQSVITHNVDVPIVFIGHKGNGKTQTFKDVAAENNMPLSILRLGSMNDVGDLLGMPYVNAKGETVYGIPEWLNIVKDGGILLIDELTRCKPTLIDAAMQILDERRFGAYRIPDSVRIFGVSNPTQDDSESEGTSYDVNGMDAALSDRCCCIRVESQSVQDGVSYMLDREYHPDVVDLVAMSEGHMDAGGTFQLPQKDYTWRGVRQLNALIPVIYDIPEVTNEIVLGCIGPNGLAVWNNRSILKEIPTAEDYFKNGSTVDVSGLDGIKMNVFLVRVLGYLRGKKATEDVCKRFTELCSVLNKQMLMYVARLMSEKTNTWLDKFIQRDNEALKKSARELMITITSGV